MFHQGIAVVVICSLIAACVRRENTAQSSPKSLAEAAAVWPKPTLVACFDDEAASVFSSAEKKIIQDTATEQYTPSRTGITFSGWAACAEGNPYQVRLFKATPPDPKACAADPKKCRAPSSFGLTSVYDKATNAFLSYGLGHAKKIKVLDSTGVPVPSKFRYEAINQTNEYAIADVLLEFDQYCSNARMKILRADCIRALAIHELGHVAGLQHEHYRNESKIDQTCIDTHNKRTYADLGKNPSDTAVTIGDYDSKSIMNYCYMDAYENGVIKVDKIELSAGDLKTLRTLYGVKSKFE